ncbi:terminase [Candidatus Wolfebacteria bacterium]|nr:MAG: terminase [Candidatus Wolfebacteria bacterium]
MSVKIPDNVKVVWEPIKDTSQEFAIDSRADDTLFYGTRGGGKSATQLMYFRKHVGLGYGQFMKGVIFDREFKNLSDLVAQSKKFFSKFDDGAVFKASVSEYKWVWPTGEELLFRHAKKVSDYDSYHGWELPFIGFNELTKWPTSEFYDLMKSTNRCSFDPEADTPRDGKTGEYLTPDKKPLPPIPLKFFSTTNPSGPGRNWVKRKYIDAAPIGVFVKKTTKVFNPQTQQKEDYTHKQVAIFSSYKENKYLSPAYIAELENISDPNKRAAWLYGSWDHASGGCFDDLWRDKVHVKQRFRVPSNWRVDRSFDWGSSHPFSVCWFAEANGEAVRLPDGDMFCPPKGTIIQIYEWYGTDEIGTNRGIKMSAPDIARGILEIEAMLKKQNWIEGKVWPGPADNQIGQTLQSDVETIEKKMKDYGVRWTKSDKTKGSRKNGFQLFRDRLESSVREEGQGFYFMNICSASLEIIPFLARDEKELDDVDTDSEEHIWDAIRYKVLSSLNRIASKIEVTYAY